MNKRLSKWKKRTMKITTLEQLEELKKVIGLG